MTSIKVGFVRDKTLLSKLIRYFGKMQTGDARFHHCFFIVNDDLVVEALTTGLRACSFEKAYAGKEVLVYDIRLISSLRANELRFALLESLGKFKGLYGFYKIPLMMCDAILTKIMKRPIFFFSKTFSTKWFPICSNFVAYNLYKYGDIKLFKDWRKFSPDLIDDTMAKFPRHFFINNSLSNTL